MVLINVLLAVLITLKLFALLSTTYNFDPSGLKHNPHGLLPTVIVEITVLDAVLITLTEELELFKT